MHTSRESALQRTAVALSACRGDLKAGIRVARKNPGMALLVMATLGLGIAVNTTVFSWVDSVLLRPIPGAADPDRIAVLEEVPTNGQTQACAYPDFRDFQAQADLFSGLAAWHLQAFMVGEGAGARRAHGQIVSANFFSVLGVRPVVGRVFADTEDRDEQAGYPLAVISERLWKAQFGGDPKVVGTAVRVNGHPLTIIGVVPAAFAGSVPGLTLDVWVHLSMIHEMGGVYGWPAHNRNAKPLLLFGRLKPGVSPEQASAQADAIARRIATLHPDTHQGTGARVVPVSESRAGGAERAAQPAANPPGRLLPRAADRLRQRYQPAAGAHRRLPARLRRSVVHRRRTVAHRAGSTGRQCRAGVARTRLWPGARDVDGPGFDAAAAPRGPAARSVRQRRIEWTSSAVRLGGSAGLLATGGNRARPPCQPDRHQRCASGPQPRLHGRTSRPPRAGSAGDGRGGPGHHRRGGRRIVRAKFPESECARAGLRAARCGESRTVSGLAGYTADQERLFCAAA